MNENERFENSLQRAFLPHEPSPELKLKSMHLTKRPSKKPLWLAFGATGLAATAALVVLFVLPTTSLAQAVIKQARDFEGHLTIYMVLPNGAWQRTGDQWIKDGKQRFTDYTNGHGEYLTDTDHGVNIGWDEDSRRVAVRDLTKNLKHGAHVPDTISVQNLKEFLADGSNHVTPRIEKTRFIARTADCISFSDKNTENKIFADPTTHRLLGWSYHHTKVWPLNPPENNYTRVYVADGEPIPPHIFDPIFEIDGKPVDVLAERKRWQGRLSNPMKVYSVKLLPRASLESGKRATREVPIAVRSVVVNRAGDVFVLFTGVSGAYGMNVLPTTIHDSTGGRYVKAAGFMPSSDGNRGPENFTFDGKPLEGGWFVRLEGGALTGPISIGFRQEFERETNFAFTYTVNPERIGDEIPAYMPYMFMPIGTHKVWMSTRIRELAEDRDRAKDFVTEEKYVRQELADMEKDDRSRRFLPVEIYYRLAHALEQQGKKRDAYAMYQKAQKALSAAPFDPGQWTKERIDSGVARLKPR